MGIYSKLKLRSADKMRWSHERRNLWLLKNDEGQEIASVYVLGSAVQSIGHPKENKTYVAKCYNSDFTDWSTLESAKQWVMNCFHNPSLEIEEEEKDLEFCWMI